jgi:hypothetical protein
MYAVIRRYQFDLKSSEEISRHIRESFIPLLRKTPGFVAYHWLDTGDGVGAPRVSLMIKLGPRSRSASQRPMSRNIWPGCWASPRSPRAK